MMKNEQDWTETFREIYEEGVARYRAGAVQARGFLSAEEREFLAGIGCSEQELFDFVEDFCNLEEPSYGTALLIQAERRDYLRTVQGNRPAGRVQPVDSFPSKQAELDGIAWLPRIMAKVRAKLRGELPPELMFG